MHGARVIIGVDLYPARLELAAEMGATHLIDGGDDGVEERLADILGDGGADVFVDNTGLPRAGGSPDLLPRRHLRGAHGGDEFAHGLFDAFEFFAAKICR